MSEGVWGRPESPHSQPIIYESIKNHVVYYNCNTGSSYLLFFFSNGNSSIVNLQTWHGPLPCWCKIFLGLFAEGCQKKDAWKTRVQHPKGTSAGRVTLVWKGWTETFPSFARLLPPSLHQVQVFEKGVWGRIPQIRGATPPLPVMKKHLWNR